MTHLIKEIGVVRFRSLGLVLLILVIGTACGPTGWPGATPTVKIGLVAPFEGLYRPLGYEALFAARLAINERNAGEGLAGYRIELVALNDFNEAKAAEIQAKALVIDPDVLGVVGHLSTASTLAALPTYRRATLAVASPWPIGATAERRPGVVSLAPPLEDTESDLETFAEGLGYENRAVIVSKENVPTDEELQALELKLDGVMAGELMLELEQMGNPLPVLGHIDVGSTQLVQVAQSAANGLMFASPAPAPTDVAGATDFIEAYKALAGFSPGPRAVLVYDATHVLLDAIEQAIRERGGRPTRSEIAAIITSVQRRGMTGPISFNEDGQRRAAQTWIYQIERGQYPGLLLTD
ncbi:MAG: branched-chain amino acid ABC transporter substrate-binding protein [Anaerolineae bacterium]|nr:branched-chain amino acid ABC transporter substrate-binding protein [Anaerolineae bacterium]